LQDEVGINTYTFVGSYSLPASDTVYQVKHSGVGGQRTDQILARLSDELDTWMPAPNDKNSCVLLHAGTNDISAHIATATIVDHIEDIIDMIDTHDSNIKIIVALIIPRYDDHDDETTDYNTALNTMLLTYQSLKSNLYIVDMNTAFKDNPDWIVDYMYDIVHPKDTGYNIMALEWAKFL